MPNPGVDNQHKLVNTLLVIDRKHVGDTQWLRCLIKRWIRTTPFSEANIVLYVFDSKDHCRPLNLKVDTPLFATTSNPLQLYHSPRAKNLSKFSYSFSSHKKTKQWRSHRMTKEPYSLTTYLSAVCPSSVFCKATSPVSASTIKSSFSPSWSILYWITLWGLERSASRASTVANTSPNGWFSGRESSYCVGANSGAWRFRRMVISTLAVDVFAGLPPSTAMIPSCWNK